MTETYIKPEITVEEFTKYFNNAVRRLKKLKCSSMEFSLDHWRVPKKWYLSLIETTHLRGFNLYPIKKYDTVAGILFLKKPCAKFNQLIAWLNKYSISNLNVDNIETMLYVADVCGKRGRWSRDDERRREFLCHNEAWCEKVKKELQKVRNTGDKLQVRIDMVDNFENMEESIRNETELYGSILRTLHFMITTPGGKVKFNSIIY
jgi:hypothetical protein